MTIFAAFDPLDPAPNYESIDAFLAEWDRRQQTDVGSCYVYAFHDATGAAFYIGKGQGTRAHDVDAHRHGRLGYYIAQFLNGIYTVHILRKALSSDDAEFLEAQLIEIFGRQLVNWAGNLGAMPSTLDQMREVIGAMRVRAKAAAAGNQLEEAVSICQDALAYVSKWERAEHETKVQELERLAATSLAARVDLQMARSDYVPQAPVLGCEALSDSHATSVLSGEHRKRGARWETSRGGIRAGRFAITSSTTTGTIEASRLPLPSANKRPCGESIEH